MAATQLLEKTLFETKHNPGTRIRVDSIDLLRGVVMVIMALDHVRDFFHYDSYLVSPEDIAQTTPGLFATRWITHICAPTFIFLSGLSMSQTLRKTSPREMSIGLIKRGLFLVLLQMTVVRFVWNFDPLLHFNSFAIISVIGACMIAMSALIHMRVRLLLILSLVMIVAHNLLDGVTFSQPIWDVIWSFIHQKKSYSLGNHYVFLVLYPIVPWVAVMAFGFCIGKLFYASSMPEVNRRNNLLLIGITAILLFFLVRLINFYGDPHPWRRFDILSQTIISFFNVEKYPPSLDFLLATLGICFVLLGVFEGVKSSDRNPLSVFGRTAMFYYVLHILVAHLCAVAAVWLSGYPISNMVYIGTVSSGAPMLRGKFGFELPEVYLLWLGIVLFLYPLCLQWNAVKMKNKGKWWIPYV